MTRAAGQSTTLTPTTHPSAGDGVLIREAKSVGLTAAFVPDTDFPRLIEAWQELRGGRCVTTSYTPTSAAELVERALTSVGLPLDSVFITISLISGEPADIGITGRPKFTRSRARQISSSLGNLRAFSTGSGEHPALRCFVAGASISLAYLPEVAA